MNKTSLLMLLPAALIFAASCSTFSEMITEQQAIQECLQKHTDAEEVSCTGMSITNGTESCSVRVVGDHNEDHRAEAVQLYNIMLREVKNFGKMDQFAFVFVNKGKQELVSFSDKKILPAEQ